MSAVVILLYTMQLSRMSGTRHRRRLLKGLNPILCPPVVVTPLLGPQSSGRLFWTLLLRQDPTMWSRSQR
jgi:hypothetical protein